MCGTKENASNEYNIEEIVNNTDCSKFKTLIFIDLEYITTKYKENGRREYLQEIVEVGAVVKQNDNVHRFSNIVKPRFYMQNTNTNYDFNKLTIDELSQGVDLSRVIMKLGRFYKPKKSLIIAWGNNDLYTINCLCHKYRLRHNFRKEDYIDLSVKFKEFYGFRKVVSLEKALLHIGNKEKYDKHRALPDTEMLVKIFDKMIADGYKDSFFMEK